MPAAKAFLDTNILVYAITASGSRLPVAEKLLLDGGNIGVQTLNELINVAFGKLKMPWPEILAWLRVIEKLCPPPLPLTASVHYRAIEIAQTSGYHIYDSLMLAAALEASCSIFYSEDMQHGHVIGDLTIHNPFGPPLHPRIKARR